MIAWTIARSALSREFSRQESPLSFFRMLRQLGWEVIPGVAEKWKQARESEEANGEAPYPAGYRGENWSLVLLVASGTRCGTQLSIAHPREEEVLSSACTIIRWDLPPGVPIHGTLDLPQDRVPRRNADSSGRIPQCVLGVSTEQPWEGPREGQDC